MLYQIARLSFTNNPPQSRRVVSAFFSPPLAEYWRVFGNFCRKKSCMMFQILEQYHKALVQSLSTEFIDRKVLKAHRKIELTLSKIKEACK